MPLLVHALWHTDPASQPLPAESIARLRPYLSRYGQTLGVSIVAVGGADDHLHLLFELPPTRTVGQATDELQRASARFVRETLNRVPFAWREQPEYTGVSPADREALTEYVTENGSHHAENDLWPDWEADAPADSSEDETPDWLREALKSKDA